MYELLYFGDLNILVKSLNRDKIHLNFMKIYVNIKII